MSTEKSDLQGPPPSYDTTQGYTQQPAPYPNTTPYPPQGPQYGGQPGAYPSQPQYGGQPGTYPNQPQYGAQPGAYTHTQQIVVTQPGGPGYVVTQARPPDYMVPSILACLCCFWPTGLCAIYYASRANTMAREGDMVESQRMANLARNLMITSVVIGICWIVLVIVLRVVVYSTTTTTYRY